MAKHVIILGAGASKTSGYPLANELRLQLSSEAHFEDALNAAYPQFGSDAHKRTVIDFFKRHADAVEAFREGGFATVDEFCKLMSQQSRANLNLLVDGMRQMTMLVLGLSNPEDAFHDSDYYPFVQRLFKEDLFSLREDLAILTFNYDPYLDFLLLRALRSRAKIRTESKELHPSLVDAVTSGFHSVRLDWLDAPGFKLLKLHGTISSSLPGARYEDFFTTETEARLTGLVAASDASGPPPIIFPWEVFSEDGNWPDRKRSPMLYHPLFKGIWARAHAEISEADKISFVGLSVHPFLKQAMKFLFKDKPHRPDIIVANHYNPDPYIERHPPHSPAQRLARMLQEIAPGLFKAPGIPAFAGFRVQSSFRDFIEREMEPLA